MVFECEVQGENGIWRSAFSQMMSEAISNLLGFQRWRNLPQILEEHPKTFIDIDYR